MRLPFPQSIPYKVVLIGAAIVGTVELLEGTDPYFTTLSCIFVLAWATAFNVTGGIQYPSGAYVFVSGLQTVVLSAIVKVCLGEPAQTHLRAPERIMEVYTAGMLAMLFAAMVSRTLRPKTSLLQKVAPITDFRSAYYGSLIISLILAPLVASFTTHEDGSLQAFLVQANKFPLLMVLTGVAYTIQRTGGRRSMSMPLFALIVSYSLWTGLTGFSKEAFLVPTLVWIVVMALTRFTLRWTHVVAIGVLIYLLSQYVVPYCNFGRNFDPEGRDSAAVAGYLLTHIQDARDHEANSEEGRRSDAVHYYGPAMGFLDRLDLISYDSALVEVTDREGMLGYAPLYTALANFVPHILWKTKPRGLWGNQYAHEIGILDQDDFTTGVSFGPSADAYHQAGFVGVLIVEPLVLTLGFVLLDSLVGDVRKSLAGVIILVYTIHACTENALYGSLLVCAQPMFSTFVTALCCAYIFPIVGSFLGSRKSRREAVPAPA